MPPGNPVFKTGTDDAKEFLKAEPGSRFNLLLKNYRLFDVLIPHSLMRHRKPAGKFYMALAELSQKRSERHRNLWLW
jgi:hypothetical protein